MPTEVFELIVRGFCYDTQTHKLREVCSCNITQYYNYSYCNRITVMLTHYRRQHLAKYLMDEITCLFALGCPLFIQGSSLLTGSVLFDTRLQRGLPLFIALFSA